MNVLKKIILFLARAALSSIFILSGIEKIIHWSAAEESVIHQLCEWSSYALQYNQLQGVIEASITWTPILLVIHIMLEVVGGVLVLLGMKVRLGAFFLILALVPSTLLFHDFWMLDGEQAQMQMIMFLKNISILGGLLILLVMGSPSSKHESLH